jgi:hypothetical protein
MRIGLLWFENDTKKALNQRVQEAIERYREKFGKSPNTCYVHPQDLNGHGLSLEGMRIVAASNILRNHLWVGWDDELENRAA